MSNRFPKYRNRSEQLRGVKDELLPSSLAGLLSLISVFLLAISVSYDWAYLNELGLSISALPTTLADHMRSAILWIPAIVVLAIPYSMMFLVWGYRPHPSHNTPAGINQLLNIWLGLAFVMLVLVPVPVGLMLFSSSLYIRFSWQIATNQAHRIQPIYVRCIWYLPVAATCGALLGVKAAGDDLMPRRVIPVEIVSPSGERQIVVQAVRRFQSVSILVKSPIDVQVVSNDRIASVGVSAPNPDFVEPLPPNLVEKIVEAFKKL